MKKNVTKSRISYAFYDWAMSPIPTLHATFIFAVYFVDVISPENGSAEWAWMSSIAAIVVAIISPLIGASADKNANRKGWLGILMIVGITATSCLWWAEPDYSWLWYALIFSFFSIVAMESLFTCYNALLSSVVTNDKMGSVSGYSWAAGYVGAIICLGLVLFLFILPEEARFGLNKEMAEHVRITMPFSGLWFLVFGLPLFFWVKERRGSKHSLSFATDSLRKTLIEGFTTAKKTPGLIRFLVARMMYADALVVVFAFGGIFATNVFGFSQQEVIFFAIAINLTAALGALILGQIEDKIGGFRTVRLSLFFLILLAFVVLLSPGKIYFWISATFMGFFIGPVQSASRTIVARVVPDDQRARIFGLYMISGKATSFLGPLLYGLLFTFLGTDRAGMAIALVFLIGSIFILGRKGPTRR